MNPGELDLALAFIEQHPQSAARELELQTELACAELIQTLPLHQARKLLSHMLPLYVARLCHYLPQENVVALLAGFNANQTAAILRGISKSRRDVLLALMPEKTAMLCRLLLSYSDDAVGAWMHVDILMLPSSCTAAEALQRFKNSDSVSMADALPVVDSNGALLGLIYLRELLRAQQQSSITPLIVSAPVTFSLSSRASLAAASRHEGWQHHDILPVLNRSKQLVGLLGHVDLRASLTQFGEASAKLAHDDFVSGITEAYKGSLVALLDLVDKTISPSTVLAAKQ